MAQPICISISALTNALCTLCSLSDWPQAPGFPTHGWRCARETKSASGNTAGNISIVTRSDEGRVASGPQPRALLLAPRESHEAGESI
jgi:hypothetical protein